MQISSLIEIVEGELLNSPSISSIYNITSEVKKIKEGDLFISKNKKDIQNAVENGAYAIVSDEILDIVDKEIAWIKVENINDAILKLLRYKLAKFDLKAYYCDEITIELLQLNKKIFDIVYLSDKIETNIKKLDDIENNYYIFSTNEKLLKTIYPNCCEFKITNYRISNIVEHSLFETTFSHKDTYFSRLKISTQYINHFLSVFYFYKKDFEITRLKQFTYFKPIFIDKNLNSLEYGSSDKFIISQNSLALAKDEIKHIKKKYSYAKHITISQKDIGLVGFRYFILEDLKDLKEFLNKKSFNCLYLIGYKQSDIESKVINSYSENSLLI